VTKVTLQKKAAVRNRTAAFLIFLRFLGGSLGRIYKFYKSHTADNPQDAIDKSAIIVAWATNVAIVTAQVRSQMFPLIVG
jgi:hypothetical protein